MLTALIFGGQRVDELARGRIMKRAVTLLCLVGCYTVISDSSPSAAQIFGAWSAPRNVVELNTTYNDSYPFLSRDGLTIYFTSNRVEGGLGGDDLWFATRESADAAWSTPHNMGAVINTVSDDSLPFLAPNEHVMYFHSNRVSGSCGEGDIWMTRRRNKHSAWEQPTNLGCVLNTNKTEIAPSYFKDPETKQTWLFY